MLLMLENAKEVLGMIAIFSYGFDVAEKNFNNAKSNLIRLVIIKLTSSGKSSKLYFFERS